MEHRAGILKQVNDDDDDVNGVRNVNMVSMNEILFIHYLLVLSYYLLTAQRTSVRAKYLHFRDFDIKLNDFIQRIYLYRTHSIIIIHYYYIRIFHIEMNFIRIFHFEIHQIAGELVA